MEKELIISYLENHLSFADDVDMITIKECSDTSEVPISSDRVTPYIMNISYYNDAPNDFDTDDIKLRITSILGDAFISLIRRYEYSYVLLVDWEKYNIEENINHHLLKIKNKVEQIEYVDSCKVVDMCGCNYNGEHLISYIAVARISFYNDYKYTINLFSIPTILADQLDINLDTDPNRAKLIGANMSKKYLYLELRVIM